MDSKVIHLIKQKVTWYFTHSSTPNRLSQRGGLKFAPTLCPFLCHAWSISHQLLQVSSKDIFLPRCSPGYTLFITEFLFFIHFYNTSLLLFIFACVFTVWRLVFLYTVWEIKQVYKCFKAIIIIIIFVQIIFVQIIIIFVQSNFTPEILRKNWEADAFLTRLDPVLTKFLGCCFFDSALLLFLSVLYAT